MTAQYDERMERLTAVSDRIAETVTEALTEQGKKAAANMLQGYGSKQCLDAGGFIYCVQNAHEASLLFLLDEGYVTLTEKGEATESVIESRKAKRALRVAGVGAEEEVAPRGGAYL